MEYAFDYFNHSQNGIVNLLSNYIYCNWLRYGFDDSKTITILKIYLDMIEDDEISFSQYIAYLIVIDISYWSFQMYIKRIYDEHLLQLSF
jgi:hypothetical protein